MCSMKYNFSKNILLVTAISVLSIGTIALHARSVSAAGITPPPPVIISSGFGGSGGDFSNFKNISGVVTAIDGDTVTVAQRKLTKGVRSKAGKGNISLATTTFFVDVTRAILQRVPAQSVDDLAKTSKVSKIGTTVTRGDVSELSVGDSVNVVGHVLSGDTITATLIRVLPRNNPRSGGK